MTSIRPNEEDAGLGWMHLYRQERPHGPALIRGNRKALELLRASIDEALGSKKAGYVEVFGESYQVRIERYEVLADLGQPPYTSVQVWKNQDR